MQVICFQSFEDTSYQLSMAAKVFFIAFPWSWSCMDGDVIHVDCHAPFVDKISEDSVHHHLECGRGVGKAKEHDHRFV